MFVCGHVAGRLWGRQRMSWRAVPPRISVVVGELLHGTGALIAHSVLFHAMYAEHLVPALIDVQSILLL